jgi:hypothetical protein
VQSAREAARRTQCVNNLKQLTPAMHNYENANGNLPMGGWFQFIPQGQYAGDLGAASSIPLQKTPDVEQAVIYNRFNNQLSPNVAQNTTAAGWGSAHSDAPAKRRSSGCAISSPSRNASFTTSIPSSRPIRSPLAGAWPGALGG